jgi:hypothetical protein
LVILDIANDIWAGFAFASPVIALLLLCYLVIAGLVALFGARERMRRRFNRMGKAVAVIVAATAGITFFAHYVWLVELRRTGHACESHASEGGDFIAKQCTLDAGFSSLRVYDSQTNWVLAERTYNCHAGFSKLIVDKQMAFDACAEGDSLIRLPPSLFDRIRAKLP